MQIAYVMSRFPATSETFILREIEAVAARGLEISVLPLFPTPPGPVHRAALGWAGRTRRATPGGVARALAAWLLRRPLRLASTLGRVTAAHMGAPAILLRALVTVGVAAQHARWVSAAGVEHVHAHYATYGALAAWTIERLAGVPYTFTAHAHDLFVDQRFLREKVSAAQAVVAISEYNRRFLVPYGGDRVTPVTVIRCGIDVRSYGYRERPVPETGDVRVLCVASLQEYKGHAVLLEALAAEPALERLSLVLVGDGPLRAALSRDAQRLGLSQRVRFAGAMTDEQVAAELDAAALFVLPSIVASTGQMEGVPVALMEAMASGVPVVSTRLSGIPELVRDGDTGLLAAPGDPASLAAAMRAAIASPAETLARARRARELVEREYDLGVTGEAMVEVLRGRVPHG